MIIKPTIRGLFFLTLGTSLLLASIRVFGAPHSMHTLETLLIVVYLLPLPLALLNGIRAFRVDRLRRLEKR